MTCPKWVCIINKKTCPRIVTKRTDSNLPRVCKSIKVTLLKLKGCFICIENGLIEIAPLTWGYFSHFLFAFTPKPYGLIERLKFLCITVNVCVSLSSEWETATARYVGINNLIREILIETAPFHSNQMKMA